MIKYELVKYIKLILPLLKASALNATKIERQYYDRLNREQHNTALFSVSQKLEKKKKLLPTVKKFFLRMFQLKIILKSYHSFMRNEESFVLFVNSSRFKKIKFTSGRELMTTLLMPLNKNGDKLVDANDPGYNNIVVLDVMFFHEFSPPKFKNNLESDIVLDGCNLILCFLFARGMFKRFHELLKVWRHLNTGKTVSMKTYIQSLREAFFIVSYHYLLTQIGEYQLYTLSYFSRAIEITRMLSFFLENCKLNYEILHGIGSYPLIEYFENLLNKSKERKIDYKIKFIRQVPLSKMYGIIDDYLAPEFCINTYFNCYRTNTLKAKIKQIAISLFNDLSKFGKLVVTVYGNKPNDFKNLISQSLEYEMLFCKIIGDVAKTSKIEIDILYVAHPDAVKKLKSWGFLKAYNIVLLDNSIPTWFFSDICFSLLSNTMFEANAFGVDAYSFLLPTNNLYPQLYMNNIKTLFPYINDRQSRVLQESMRGLCEKKKSIADKITERVSLIC